MVKTTLPPVTENLEEAKEHMKEFGCALIGNALTPEEVSEAKERLIEQAAAEVEQGLAWLDGKKAKWQDEVADKRRGPNQRVRYLLNKGEIFRQIVQKEKPLALIKWLFGEAYPAEWRESPGEDFDDLLLSSFTANIVCKGSVPMVHHVDQGYAPIATPYPLVCNMAWMLTDFTEDNGATLVTPGSHKEPHPDYFNNPPEMVPLVAPAGTVAIFEGRLWHAAGENKTDDPRYALLSYFCRPFVRQQDNAMLSLAPETIEKCSPELLKMLGFKVWHTLGNVQGAMEHGAMTQPLDTHVTELHL